MTKKDRKRAMSSREEIARSQRLTTQLVEALDQLEQHMTALHTEVARQQAREEDQR